MKQVKRQLRYTQLAEDRYFGKKQSQLIKGPMDSISEKISQKIPMDLAGLLEKLFEKAFYFVFEKGTGLIEKTYNKEDIEVQYLANNFVFEVSGTRSSAKNMSKAASKHIKQGRGMAFLEGGALGALGIGLPDIPIFIGLLLQGIYKTALSYGFDYLLYPEKIYMLKLIQVAFAEGEERERLNQSLDAYGRSIGSINWFGSLESEIKQTSKALSDNLLLAKFVQGLPIVGASGAIFNYSAYSKVSKLAAIKYKKRYLENKLNVQRIPQE